MGKIEEKEVPLSHHHTSLAVGTGGGGAGDFSVGYA